MNLCRQASERQLTQHVANAVLMTFAALPKHGKPQDHEHTVLAGIVAYATDPQQLCSQQRCQANADKQAALPAASSDGTGTQCAAVHVIAVGTGTKCLGGSKRSAAGDVINDSHAEVIARRAFLAWVYQQLQLAAQDVQQQQRQQSTIQEVQQQYSQDIQHQHQQQASQLAKQIRQPSAEHAQQQCQVQPSDLHGDGLACSSHLPCRCKSAFYWCTKTGKFVLHAGIKFAMFVSQPPCGDASIYKVPQHGCTSVTPAQPCQHLPRQCSGTDQCSLQHANARTEQQQQQPQLQQAVQHVQATPVVQHSNAGRTGAKLIRLSGVMDVGQAAVVLQSTGQQADFGQSGIVDLSLKRAPATQPAALYVPCAADVESGPQQQLGACRRKPGKGDPTLSMSCSDKIARWCCLGLQGCLLSCCLAEPLYINMLGVSVPGSSKAVTASGDCNAWQGIEAAIVEVQQTAAEPVPSFAVGTETRVATAVAQLQQGVLTSQQQGANAPQQPACWPHTAAAAAEAAGQRAVSGRLAGCSAVLHRPYHLQAPVVVALVPAASRLGLSPDANRTSPQGKLLHNLMSCKL
eukprot:GHRR01034051.1.p1 GENE.GHRR01034051.1~~GHRR01034051.1.p1  ORF type:complete len:575 (+),score=220.71 GHRR01034051.1:1685-3409(+)